MSDPRVLPDPDGPADDAAPLYRRRRNPTHMAIAYPKEAYDARTVVVIGSGRGGTSAIAGAIHALGIRMVEPGHQAFNVEDLDFIEVSLGRGLAEGEPRHAATCRGIEALIASRTASYRDWGWKDPSAGFYLETVINRCRNPLVVFVWRNPFDVATSMVAANAGLSIEQAMGFAMRTYEALWGLVQKCGVPTLLVSYERAITQRETFVNELSAFLRIAPTEDCMLAAIEHLRPGGGYRMADRAGPVL